MSSAEEFAPYEPGKIYNSKNLFYARTIYSFGGLKYIYDNHQRILAKANGRTKIFAFVASVALLDCCALKEFMKDRDKTDVLFY